MTFPARHRAKLHSTNSVERLSAEIKPRADVVGIFPNEAAITRLVGAILMEQTEEWAVQRSRYMTLETPAPIGARRGTTPRIVPPSASLPPSACLPRRRTDQLGHAGHQEARTELHHTQGRDTFDCEAVAHVAVTGAGISGSDVRDVLLAAVEKRFGADRAPHPVEHLSDDSSCHTACETRDFARQLGLVPRFAPVRSPEINGMSEAFVQTLKRDYARITPLPHAATVLELVPAWIDDRNTVHPHSAMAMRWPAELRATLNPSQSVR